MENLEFLVNKQNIKEYKFVKTSIPSLTKGEILLKIDKFGFSANNITYVVLGESYKYFDFFPAENKYFGKVNVWAIATVIDSKHDDIFCYQKFYGYFPIAKFIVLTPATVKKDFFYVERKQLPSDRKVYNQYYNCSNDSQYSKQINQQDLMLVYRPLFWTSFFLDDYLNENKFFDANTVVISSASSKTAFCLGYLLKQRNINVIGLTSKRNFEFVKNLNIYNSVVEYKNFKSIKEKEIIYIDVSGDSSLLNDFINYFEVERKSLKLCIQVGLSHWQDTKGFKPQSKKIQMFFAPTWIKKRQEELGPTLLMEKQARAWKIVMEYGGKWIQVKKNSGFDDFENTLISRYEELLSGSNPKDGFVLCISAENTKSNL